MKENSFQPSRKKNILCVEDDHDTCELLSVLLPEYKMTFAHSLGEALRLLESQPFDLFILDNWLPDGSGVEFCEKLRAANSSAPVVFTSGVGRRADIQKALDAGANKYLVKPYEPEHLQQVVKELLGDN